jgi:rfaE bifunctional protein nucleotidyltransferase chain/domain
MDRTDPIASKILPLEILKARRADARRVGERVVHCHGCFDIVHPGHIRHLRDAARLGDRLLVSITADGKISKGDGRPLFDETLRAENLAALSFVDWVHVCPGATAEGLLEEVTPDIFVKGREYEEIEDPRFQRERSVVERNGGKVVFSSGDVVFSSTALIQAMTDTIDGPVGEFESPGSARLRQLRDRHQLDAPRLESLLDSARGKRMVVFGEVVLDTYTHCAWPEIAGESPMLSLRPLESVSFDGGAAIIALHLAALGARVTLVTPLPSGLGADAMRSRLEVAGVEVWTVPTAGRLPEKERLLVGREKMVKLDRTGPLPIDERARRDAVGMAIDAAGGADGAIVVDFGLGLLTPRLTRGLFESLRPLVRTLAGDVSGARETLLAMHHADWLSPSESEMRLALGDRDSSLSAVAWELREKTHAASLAATLGAEGLVIFQDGEPPRADGRPGRLSSEHVPALCPTAIDGLGCGDALLATAGLALASGGTPIEAAYLGSVAAACEASSLGNIPVSPRAVRERLRRLDESRISVLRIRPTSQAAG